MKVKAKERGLYNNKRRKEGDVFHIKSEKEFSKKWMVAVGKGKPAPDADPEDEPELPSEVEDETEPQGEVENDAQEVEEPQEVI